MGVVFFFIAKTADVWTKFNTPVFIAIVFMAFAFAVDFKSQHRRFWGLWTGVFALLFFSHYFTQAFHPWRLDTFLMFGASFMLAEALSEVRARKMFFLIALCVLTVFSLFNIFSALLFQPPLLPGEKTLVQEIGALPATAVPLATHDVCANTMTLTGKTCLLDISYECLPDARKTFELENVYWASSLNEVKRPLEKYGATHVAYTGGDSGRGFIESLDVNKQYASWTPGALDASLYSLNKIDGSIDYYDK